MTLTFLSIMTIAERNKILHNDIQYNAARYNDTDIQHYDANTEMKTFCRTNLIIRRLHSNFQHNNIQHNELQHTGITAS